MDLSQQVRLVEDLSQQVRLVETRFLASNAGWRIELG